MGCDTRGAWKLTMWLRDSRRLVRFSLESRLSNCRLREMGGVEGQRIL